MKATSDEKEDFLEETMFSFDFETEKQIPPPKNAVNIDNTTRIWEQRWSTKTDSRAFGPAPESAFPLGPKPVYPMKPKRRRHAVDKDIAAYKRVIWQHLNE